MWLAVLLFVWLLSACATPSPQPEAAANTQPVINNDDNLLQQAAAAALGNREGALIVIDPQNGRLRAVVNPRVAYEQTFPPGSAIKPFTALAALRAGLITRESGRVCSGRYARGGFKLVCSHPKSNGPLDLAQALAYSCNDYFAHVGERLSQGAFNNLLNDFGFGARTGVNAGAEAAGSLPQGDGQVRATLGESEQLLVTPLQMLTAYAALFNGGHLYRPQRLPAAGFVAQERARLRIAPAHRATLLAGLRGAVKYGTAARAELPAYVFGKTGTSTSSNGFRTQGWFVGFAEAEQIKLGVLVFLKRAHGAQCAEMARALFVRQFANDQAFRQD